MENRKISSVDKAILFAGIIELNLDNNLTKNNYF